MTVWPVWVTNGVAATADGIVRGTNGVLYVGYGAGNQSAI